MYNCCSEQMERTIIISMLVLFAAGCLNVDAKPGGKCLVSLCLCLCLCLVSYKAEIHKEASDGFIESVSSI